MSEGRLREYMNYIMTNFDCIGHTSANVMGKLELCIEYS